MATLRTSPPPTYIPPTSEEMKAMAQKVGVGKFCPDFVEDIVNLITGGSVNPPSSYLRMVEEGMRQTLPAETANGWELTVSGGWTRDREKAIRERAQKRMSYHQAVSDFIRAMDLEGLPGSSPLEQAMSLLKLLVTQKGAEPKEGGLQGGDDYLPIFVDGNPEGVATKMNEAVDLVESLTEDEQQLISDESGSDTEVDKGQGQDPAQARKLAEDMLKGKDKMIEIARHLNTLSRMRVRRQRKVEPDPEGEEVRYRPMRHLGEIGRIPQAEWALPRPYRMYRHITSQTQVRERCTRIEKKQLLYIIIDCSGSMGQGQRIYKAGGILMNRLQAVIAGEAELYVRLFDTKLKEEHYAATPEEARGLMKHFTEKNYSGGSTDIPGCMKAAQARIDDIIAQGVNYRPELVVITDGDDDTSSLSLGDFFPGTKIHAFLVGCKNKHLVKLAERTGGVGVENM